MAQTLAGITPLLREVLLTTVDKTWYANNELWNMLERQPARAVGGKNFLVDVEVRTNRSARNTSEGGDMPAADQVEYRQISIPVCTYMAVGELTGHAFRRSIAEDQLIDYVTREIKGVADSIQYKQGYDAWNATGGALAVLTSAPSAVTTFTVDTAVALDEGQPIVVCDAADGGNAVARTITNLSAPVAGVVTVTVSSAVTFAAGALVMPPGITGTTSIQFGQTPLDGLAKIVDDNNTYAGVDRTAVGTGYWRSLVVDGSSGLQLNKIQFVQQNLKTRGGGISLNWESESKLSRYVIITSFAQWRNLGTLFFGQREWMGNTQKIDGMTAFEMDGWNVVASSYCPAGKMYFIDRNYLKLKVESTFQMEDMTGAIFRAKTGSASGTYADAFQFSGHWVGQVYSPNPRRLAVMENLPTDGL